MNNETPLYRAVKVSEKPEKTDDYFVINEDGVKEIRTFDVEKSKWWVVSKNPPAHYLVPLLPIQGLTQKEILQIIRSVKTDWDRPEFTAFELNSIIKEVCSHYEPLLSSERAKHEQEVAQERIKARQEAMTDAINYRYWFEESQWKCKGTLDNGEDYYCQPGKGEVKKTESELYSLYEKETGK